MDIPHVSNKLSQTTDAAEATKLVQSFYRKLKNSGLSENEIEKQLNQLRERVEARMYALDDRTDPEGVFRQSATAAYRTIRRIVECQKAVIIHLEEFGEYDPEETKQVPSTVAPHLDQIRRTLNLCLTSDKLGWVEEQLTLQKGATNVSGEPGFITLYASVKDVNAALQVIRGCMKENFPDFRFSTSHS